MIRFRLHTHLIRMAILVFLPVMATMTAHAQEMTGGGKQLSAPETGDKKVYKPGNCWTLSYPLGGNIASTMDTLTYNYQRLSIPSMVSDAYASTAPLGGPGINMIFFNRRERSDFFFNDAAQAWIPTQYKQKFYNVYIPMTLLSYNFGGGKQTRQDRLQATFAGNVNRRIGIGASLDYLYSKGSYANQAAKEFNFGFEAYYRGDRYEMQAFFNHYNHVNKENGGITDDLYITDPGELQGGVDHIDSKSIPTRLSAAHSRLNGSQFYMNHSYNVGFWREEEVNDTLTRQIYVPVTKFIYSLDYKQARHLFKNTSPSEAENFWGNTYFNNGGTYDNTHYWSLANSLGVQLVEGFNKWVPFGLSAYTTFETRRFRLPTDYDFYSDTSTETPGEGDDNPLTPLPEGVAMLRKGSQNLLWIGARLESTKGKFLRYAADAKFGIIGDVAADLHIDAEAEGRFRMLGDTVSIKAKGFFHNEAQPWLIKHYLSNHFAWNNSDFGKTRRFRIGGELTIPWTGTRIEAGVENLQNYVYFNTAGLPTQHGGSVQVFSASLHQKLKFGIWNWDNTITYQTSSNQNVIPLPALAIYSNMYLGFTAFRVLHLQIGVDCDYYTRYNGLNYQPATMTFTANDEGKVGNFPLCNVYAMAKLYKVRFYVLYSHVNQGWFTKDYFSMPHYPINPRMLQFGLSVDFAN